VKFVGKHCQIQNMDNMFAYVSDTPESGTQVVLSDSPRDWSLEYDWDLEAYR
jgi:hypothetical protein